MANPLSGKSVVLGVTGSIAAYKAADLASKLHQSGALVDVVLTESARQFITPLSFQSVTSRKAYVDQDLWGGEGHVTHIQLGHTADLIVVAPASANTLAKLAAGIADNLLTLTILASHCPVLIAPAMDGGMYSNEITQRNIELLKNRGFSFIGPAEGHLASGLTGPGRMVEPAEILGEARYTMGKDGKLSGIKVVVTAGGTQEPIDPVRLVTNRSSGKQGYAVAQAALDAGAETILITAPTSLVPPKGSRVIPVKTASEMLEAVLYEVNNSDVLIMAAAVADYSPQMSQQKIKKSTSGLVIDLQPTQDILKAIAQRKETNHDPRIVIGFAAESQNLIENATKKLRDKKLDIIVANDIASPGSGFEVDTNQVVLLYPDGTLEKLPLLNKDQVADIIVDKIAGMFHPD